MSDQPITDPYEVAIKQHPGLVVDGVRHTILATVTPQYAPDSARVSYPLPDRIYDEWAMSGVDDPAAAGFGPGYIFAWSPAQLRSLAAACVEAAVRLERANSDAPLATEDS